MARANTTKYALLGVLKMGAASGYEIKRFCDESIAYFWNENYGHIYPVLRQMEAEGLVTMLTETKPGRPAKNVYSITDAGERELDIWLRSPIERRPYRIEMLLKLVFSKDLADELIIEMLGREIADAETQLAQLQAIEAHLQGLITAANEREMRLWLASVSFGQRFNRMHREWCKDLIESLRTLRSRTEGP